MQADATIKLMDYERLLQEVIKIAQEAGGRIMEVYEQDFAFTDKDDDMHSPLTEADTAAHTSINAALSELEPKLPILSEEGEELPDRESMDKLWIVDPLDGTKEFIKKNGEFTVNIALVENGVPTLGVVHAPAIGVTYAGYGKTAYKIKGGDKQEIVSTTGHGEPVKVVASRSHQDEHLIKFMEQMGEYETTNSGSSLKLCLVAEGSAHLYPRLAPTMEWDTAAGDAVVRAAGGGVYQLNGESLLYNKANLYNSFFIVTTSDAPEWQSKLPKSLQQQ